MLASAHRLEEFVGIHKEVLRESWENTVDRYFEPWSEQCHC